MFTGYTEQWKATKTSLIACNARKKATNLILEVTPFSDHNVVHITDLKITMTELTLYAILKSGAKNW